MPVTRNLLRGREGLEHQGIGHAPIGLPMRCTIKARR